MKNISDIHCPSRLIRESLILLLINSNSMRTQVLDVVLHPGLAWVGTDESPTSGLEAEEQEGEDEKRRVSRQRVRPTTPASPSTPTSSCLLYHPHPNPLLSLFLESPAPFPLPALLVLEIAPFPLLGAVLTWSLAGGTCHWSFHNFSPKRVGFSLLPRRNSRHSCYQLVLQGRGL